jgi:radical SAM protein with 4Fe4S-binding SPASM domain
VVSPPFGITERTFLRHRAQNPCWGGKLAILDDGEVLPCVFARDWATGNVRQQELAEVLRGAALRDAWGFTKDRIDTCRDCEYRYACFDCRPLAMGMNGGRASAQTHGCVYRPDRQ